LERFALWIEVMVVAKRMAAEVVLALFMLELMF
jgi:hypothetical protein